MRNRGVVTAPMSEPHQDQSEGPLPLLALLGAHMLLLEIGSWPQVGCADEWRQLHAGISSVPG